MDGIVQEKYGGLLMGRLITLRLDEHGIEVCTHPELTPVGGGLSVGGCVQLPYKHGGGTVESSIKYLEDDWNAKSEVMTDTRSELGPVEEVVLTKRQFRKRTKKFKWDMPKSGIIHWRPPTDKWPYWHAWISPKTPERWFPTKTELSELLPILNSLTGGTWEYVKSTNSPEFGIIMTSRDPPEQKGLFTFQEES